MMVVGPAYNSVHALLALDLLRVKLLEELLILSDLFLGLFDTHLEVEKEIGRLDLLEALLNSLMLFN